MESPLDVNLRNWEDRVKIHVRSAFYDVPGWLRRAPYPPARETQVLGNVRGKTLVQLQCHFGMDALCWARAGSVVTGLDFSPSAIDEARALAVQAGLADRSTFVCANVYDAREALGGQRYDVVYVSLGSLGWLPDITAWAEVVASLLSPGGKFYLHDVHPIASSFDDEGDRIIYSYFEEPDAPFVSDSDTTYTDGEHLASTRTFEWNHSIGEIVNALTRQGLIIDSLTEHDWTLFQQFPWLKETESGIYAVTADHPRFPLSFTLVAHATA